MPPEIASPTPNGLSGETSEPLVPHEQAAVETFRFEVSADKKLAPVIAPRREDLRDDPPHAKPATSTIDLGQQADPYPIEGFAASRLKSARTFKRLVGAPAWLGSLLINSGIMIGMALFTITGLPQGFDFTLSLSTEPALADETLFEEIAIEPLEDFENVENQLANEITQTAVAASELSDEVSLADFASASLADAALSDTADMFAGESGGLAEIVPSGDKLTASFFGTKVDGRRILYVLDNSGGMKNGGLEVLIDELIRSIESLSPEQEFYVIFYSDMVYPLFHPRPVERFVPANERFKKRLKVWLDSVELCVGNSVDEAIQAATMIDPDAVYLLTDGDVNTTPDGRKLAALSDRHGRDFPIHTFGIGMGENSKAAENLRLVAEANNGTFLIVDVSEEAKERARQESRPYHNKEPGRVWGLNVGRGWGR